MTPARFLTDDARAALLSARHSDPYSVLGPHDGRLLVFAPGALAASVALPDDSRHPLQDLGDGFFGGSMPGDPAACGPGDYQLALDWPGGEQLTADAYAFGPILTDEQLRALAGGSWRAVAACLGSELCLREGVAGLRCAVWAPNARRVAVVGDFNGWDARRHGMRLRHDAGVWEIFVPGVMPGERYKFALIDAAGRESWRADPVARRAEPPPATASVATACLSRAWTDGEWMATRSVWQAPDAPLSIYEVHAGSWLAQEGAGCVWEQLADKLPGYAQAMGFTHVELLPVMEHPFGGSWGYQPLGLFAPAARYGPPEAFAHFVERCHEAGVGVILDWVPAHFPDDPHGLARYDGTALYEHADPREGFHPDWHTHVYNLGRTEVRAFLIASAIEWLKRFHVDGLRVDAVASMLYRDYSRASGEWVPNEFGGRENLEAVQFLKELNATVHAEAPGAIMIAEESTAWPGVTAPVEAGGLGFDYKWNMGWMHDTLSYMSRDPVHRRHHHHDMTFSMVYAYSERFMLPISHDEVVHGKGSLLGRMPGDAWRRFANLRAYLGYMWAHPGKKLLFMGSELGDPREWNHDRPMDWNLLDESDHRGVQRLVSDLNRVLRETPPLYALDADARGFSWAVPDDGDNSVLAFLRHDGRGPSLLAVSNFTPVPREGYRIGVPAGGFWREILNTDARVYGGTNTGNLGGAHAQDEGLHGQPRSLTLTLPPLSTLYLMRED
jgi:1,4-alpha-glucan branching enzyme